MLLSFNNIFITRVPKKLNSDLFHYSVISIYLNSLIIRPDCQFLWICSFYTCAAHATLYSTRTLKLTNCFIMMSN